MAANTLVINSYEELQTWFSHFDEEAKKIKYRRFRPAWITGILLGLVAVYLFAYMLVFGVEEEVKLLLVTIEVGCLILSFVLLNTLANYWYGRFLLKRRIAEILRIQILLADHHLTLAGQHERHIRIRSRDDYERSIFSIPDPAAGQDTVPKGDYLILFHPLAQGTNGVKSLHDFKTTLIEVLNNQIAHHQDTRLAVFRKRKHQLNTVLSCIKYIFLCVVLLKYGLEIMIHDGHATHLEPFVQIVSFYIILLPTIFAALEGVKHFSDWKRNIAISERKVIELRELQDEIINGPPDELPYWTKQLKANLESENTDWMERNAGRKLEPLF